MRANKRHRQLIPQNSIGKRAVFTSVLINRLQQLQQHDGLHQQSNNAPHALAHEAKLWHLRMEHINASKITKPSMQCKGISNSIAENRLQYYNCTEAKIEHTNAPPAPAPRPSRHASKSFCDQDQGKHDSHELNGLHQQSYQASHVCAHKTESST